MGRLPHGVSLGELRKLILIFFLSFNDLPLNSIPSSSQANEPPAGQLRFVLPEVSSFVSSLFTATTALLPSKYFSTGGDELNIPCFVSLEVLSKPRAETDEPLRRRDRKTTLSPRTTLIRRTPPSSKVSTISPLLPTPLSRDWGRLQSSGRRWSSLTTSLCSTRCVRVSFLIFALVPSPLSLETSLTRSSFSFRPWSSSGSQARTLSSSPRRDSTSFTLLPTTSTSIVGKEDGWGTSKVHLGALSYRGRTSTPSIPTSTSLRRTDIS